MPNRGKSEGPPPTHRKAALPMEINGIAQCQIATRIPRGLHKRMKLHCMENDTNVQTFVAEALQERMDAMTAQK